VPRRCTVCDHPERHSIDEALVTGAPYRSIAKRFGLSESAVYRHKSEHLPAHLLKARELEEAARADDLLEQVRHLQAHALDILERAEKAGDLRPPWPQSPRQGVTWSCWANSLGSWMSAPW
jgi:hypothetical protein